MLPAPLPMSPSGRLGGLKRPLRTRSDGLRARWRARSYSRWSFTSSWQILGSEVIGVVMVSVDTFAVNALVVVGVVEAMNDRKQVSNMLELWIKRIIPLGVVGGTERCYHFRSLVYICCRYWQVPTPIIPFRVIVQLAVVGSNTNHSE